MLQVIVCYALLFSATPVVFCASFADIKTTMYLGHHMIHIDSCLFTNYSLLEVGNYGAEEMSKSILCLDGII